MGIRLIWDPEVNFRFSRGLSSLEDVSNNLEQFFMNHKAILIIAHSALIFFCVLLALSTLGPVCCHLSMVSHPFCTCATPFYRVSLWPLYVYATSLASLFAFERSRSNTSLLAGLVTASYASNFTEFESFTEALSNFLRKAEFPLRFFGWHTAEFKGIGVRS